MAVMGFRYLALSVFAFAGIAALSATSHADADPAVQQVASAALIPGAIPTAPTPPLEISMPALPLPGRGNDADSVRAVIEAQLNAFHQRDAMAAFAVTSSDMRAHYDQNPKQFLQTVRFEARPLYTHQSYKFQEQSVLDDNSRIQKVELTTAHKGVVTVLFRLDKNQNGGWAVDSWTVLDNEALAI